MTTSAQIRLSDVIAPSFYDVHRDIRRGGHTHYLLGGGRGSCKSSFAAAEIVLGIMQDKNANGAALRKIGQNLRDSVYEQLLWAIDKLGVSSLWEGRVSVPELIYKPTGQKIILRGADNPKKLKSVKFALGYAKYVWFEEADEFSGQEEIDIINQSLLRGGEGFVCLYTYNPPRSADSWINAAGAVPRADRLLHMSDYRTVPPEWLGRQFISEAEYLKESDPLRYRSEYLGEVTGTGLEVFPNVRLRVISGEEIQSFERVYRGIDWGYGADPFVYLEAAYDRGGRRVHIFNEFYRFGARFDEIAAEIRKTCEGGTVTADSAEPRSNDELKERGICIRGAKKGQGSVEHGIRLLQDMNEIVIDPVRCPNAAREFSGYRLAPDGCGGCRGGFPDKDNHTIDALRYALEDALCKRSVGYIDRKKLGI